MATIAPGLNFRIGADVKGVNKAIREAEKSLRGAVQSFSSIGNSLSLALSAPLAAFGVMSVKAAGEMENLRFALEGTMKDAGRTVGEARMELEALRKAALAPGLDFEQAVRGSVRLQSVGIKAEEARRIIVELANALALSGGTADQLDGVTKQFTQMIGKGKILQEDISIILENMPALASVMKKEFGQTTAEGLTKAGVSVSDFITRLTDGMTKLERAQGGISNAITNAMSAVRQALADVGVEIDKTFGVSNALNEFGTWVQNLAAWFRNLDDSTKRTIGAVVAFAAALGPAFKIMQGGVWIAGQLNLAFLGLQKLLAQSMAGQAIPSLIAKWKALDFAMKASVIGGIAAVVLAAAVAFQVLNGEMSDAAKAAQTVEHIQRDSLQTIAEQKTRVELLAATVKDETKSEHERIAALNQLKAISPEHFKNLDIEQGKVKGLDMAVAGYVNSIQRAAFAQAAFNKLSKNAGEILDLQLQQQSKLTDAEMFAAGIAGKTNKQVYDERNAKIQQQIESLGAQNEAIKKVIDSNGGIVQTSQAVAVAQVTEKDAVNALAKSYTELDKAAKTANRGKQTADLKAFKGSVSPTIQGGGGLPGALTSGEGLPKAVMAATAAMGDYMTISQQFGAINKAIGEGVADLSLKWTTLSDAMLVAGQTFAGIGLAVVGSMEQIAASGGGLKEMADGVLGSLKKVIGGLIKTGVAAVVTKALLSSALGPFAALALGAASGALAQGLFNSLINKIKIPALAEGGVLHGPRMVLAGEYAGARTNPEIVTPENKMRDVFNEVLGRSGGIGGGQLVARVSGNDLLFVIEKAQSRGKRQR